MGKHIQKTQFRFGNFNEYEAYNNALDMDYDSEDSFLLVFFII